eukprot:gene22543-29669_t
MEQTAYFGNQLVALQLGDINDSNEADTDLGVGESEGRQHGQGGPRTEEGGPRVSGWQEMVSSYRRDAGIQAEDNDDEPIRSSRLSRTTGPAGSAGLARLSRSSSQAGGAALDGPTSSRITDDLGGPVDDDLASGQEGLPQEELPGGQRWSGQGRGQNQGRGLGARQGSEAGQGKVQNHGAKNLRQGQREEEGLESVTSLSRGDVSAELARTGVAPSKRGAKALGYSSSRAEGMASSNLRRGRPRGAPPEASVRLQIHHPSARPRPGGVAPSAQGPASKAPLAQRGVRAGPASSTQAPHSPRPSSKAPHSTKAPHSPTRPHLGSGVPVASSPVFATSPAPRFTGYKPNMATLLKRIKRRTPTITQAPVTGMNAEKEAQGQMDHQHRYPKQGAASSCTSTCSVTTDISHSLDTASHGFQAASHHHMRGSMGSPQVLMGSPPTDLSTGRGLRQPVLHGSGKLLRKMQNLVLAETPDEALDQGRVEEAERMAAQAVSSYPPSTTMYDQLPSLELPPPAPRHQKQLHPGWVATRQTRPDIHTLWDAGGEQPGVCEPRGVDVWQRPTSLDVAALILAGP